MLIQQKLVTRVIASNMQPPRFSVCTNQGKVFVLDPDGDGPKAFKVPFKTKQVFQTVLTVV